MSDARKKAKSMPRTDADHGGGKSINGLEENTKRTGILYQSEDRDVTLMDIPTSIAVAQGRADVLLSTPPLEKPILMTRAPKTEKKKERHAESVSGQELHDEYKKRIERALNQICTHVSGDWCTPRKLMTQAPKGTDTDMDVDDPEKDLEARLREWSTSKGDEDLLESFNFQKMMAQLGAVTEPNATLPPKWVMSYKAASETVKDMQAMDIVPQETQQEWHSCFYNSAAHAVSMTVSDGNATASGSAVQEYSFSIPPHSGLFLNDTMHPEDFRASFRELTDEHRLPRHFDFVLLDPPWPNRSAKRAGAYSQVGGIPYITRMLQMMDIDSYLENNALVGIWITNKETLREVILGPGGLFEGWNVKLVEEWVWVKTTVQGEPMFGLDNVYRKPYETLLLGRYMPKPVQQALDVRRRVIAAVPDVHSRKPCIKELIEHYMPDPEDYSALEIFSRHLVSGWMSWGNEVIKYNWDRYWVSADD